MEAPDRLSPWWKHSVILTVVAGLTIVIWLAANSYRDAPSIPERVLSPSGETVFTTQDVHRGQLAFVKCGLMSEPSSFFIVEGCVEQR
jgi:nitric oxide reductase subunit B